MKRLLFVGGLTALLISNPVVAEQAEPSAPRCLCNVTNLTRCEGTGPTLLHVYLWSQPERGSQWFDVGATFPTRSPEECRALDMMPVPGHIPVFNYYGSLVHGCALTWRNCEWTLEVSEGI